MSESDGNTRLALVTGANRGLGLETSRQLASRGVTVLLTARASERAAEAAAVLASEGLPVLWQQLDVTDADSIAAARRYVERTFGRLDILINNAGVSQMGSRCRASAIPLDIVRSTFEVNVFGLMAVTNAMMPLLARSSAGRIVNVSSVMGSMTLALDPTFGFWRAPDDLVAAYSASKAAVTALTLQYATELRDTHIKVNAVCPGYTATDMTGRQGRPVPEGARIITEMALIPDTGPTGAYVNDRGPIPW